MNKLNTAYLTIFFIFISIISFGQKENDAPAFYLGGLNINNGYIWPHTSRIYYIKASAIEVQAKIYLNLKNTSDWSNPYKATKFGYSLTYIKTNNIIPNIITRDNSKLGDIYGLNIFIEPMLVSYKRFHLYAHLGAGIAYATERYNRFTNDSNLLISTPFSFFFNGKINLDYELTNKLSFGLNFGMSHCSNAALNLPNLGMNVVNYGLNFGYKIFTQQQPNENLKIIPFWEKNISIGYATRNCNENIDKYYQIYTLDFELNHHFNRKNAISFNLNYLLRQGEILDKTFNKTYNSYYGLAIGHELFIKKLSLISQLGAYVYDTNQNLHNWYARLGVRYYFLPNFYSSILLTNRKQSADLLQLSFGYSFK